MADQRIIALGLLTKDDLGRLGDTFTRLWPVGAAHCFDEILEAIDEAEKKLSMHPEKSRAKDKL